MVVGGHGGPNVMGDRSNTVAVVALPLLFWLRDDKWRIGKLLGEISVSKKNAGDYYPPFIPTPHFPEDGIAAGAV